MPTSFDHPEHGSALHVAVAIDIEFGMRMIHMLLDHGVQPNTGTLGKSNRTQLGFTGTSISWKDIK